jgi:hypothetical protein
MSDFVNKPLDEIMNQENPLTRIKNVELATGAGPTQKAASLQNIAENSGTIVADLILAPASGVETQEPTSTDYTGSFMSGSGKTFDGTDYNIGGVAAGVLQAGISQTTGQITFGANAGNLDADGARVDMAVSTPGLVSNTPNSYKISGINGAGTTGNGNAVFEGWVGAGSDAEATGKIKVFTITAPSAPYNSYATLILEANGASSASPAEGSYAHVEMKGNNLGTSTAGTRVTNGFFGFGVATVLTIAAGVVTANRSYHKIAVQSGVTDDLDTINGGSEGDILVLQADDGAKDIVVKHATGNIRINGSVDFTLTALADKITLIKTSVGNWNEIGRGDNGV